MRKWALDDKVDVRIGRKKVPGIIAKSEDGAVVRVRIAIWSELHKRWCASDYPAPVERTRLTERYTAIPGLDPDYNESMNDQRR